MDTKRQTIWLVSMLSLMIVLSAYYLLTEDPNKMYEAANDGLDSDEISVDVTGTGLQEGGNLGSQLFPGLGDGLLADKLQNDAMQTAKTDQEILDSMLSQSQSASSFFEREQMKRNEELSKQWEQLEMIISDSKQSNEAVEQALAQIKQMEWMQTRISQLEDELTKNYPNAIVMRDSNDKWKVTVQADKLEKSQVVSIIDEALMTLDIAEEDISVDIQ